MAVRITTCRALATMTCGAFLILLIAAGQAQAVLPLSEVKITVLDPSGAVIPGSEVAFNTDSKTIVAQTGRNGSVTVTLPTGRYVVTATHLGFLKNEVSNFQVTAPEPNELRVILNVGRAIVCTLPCGDFAELRVLTTTSDLPNFIEYDPDPSAKPVAAKA